MNGLSQGSFRVLLTQQNLSLLFSLSFTKAVGYLRLTPSQCCGSGYAAASGRKSSRLSDYYLNCFHLGCIMVRFLVISTIIYKSLCPLALHHYCYESSYWELICLLLPYITSLAACHFIYSSVQKKSALLIINVCTLYLWDPEQIRQHTKTSIRHCVSEVVLVAISKWDVLDVVKCWKRVETQMWWAVSFRNYFNYAPHNAAQKESQQ